MLYVMDEIVTFEGKKYISARRAAKEYDYSIDYIGQLARASKVEARMVGRTYYIYEPSIISYKRSGNGHNNNLEQVRSSVTPRKHYNHSLESVMATLLLGAIFGSLIFVFIAPPMVGTDNRLLQASSGDLISDLWRYISSLWDKILAMFSRDGEKLTKDTKTDKVQDRVGLETDVNSGLVVVPSTGSEESDISLTQRVKNSFSDEVVVEPDETGASGVIKPIFKNRTGAEYIYVLVPITR